MKKKQFYEILNDKTNIRLSPYPIRHVSRMNVYYQEAYDLGMDIRELTTLMENHEYLAVEWHQVRHDDMFSVLVDASVERDWHLQLVDTYRRKIAKLTKQADRLRRKARRFERRNGI